MSDPASALLDAMVGALRASSALATAMGLSQPRIFAGVVPTNAPLPYVLIGDSDQVLGDDEECTDAASVVTTVNAWSRPEPPQAGQIRAMGAAIRAALSVELMVAGQDCVEHEFQDARYGTDPDNSSHATLTFEFWLTPTS